MEFHQKTAHSINNKVLALLVAGILILVNILSLRYFIRFDLTEGEQYSISDSTISILNDLDDIVTVKAYFSSELPPQFVPVQQYLSDLLGEYQAYSGGNLDYEFVDPSEDTEAFQEAQSVGVQQVRMQILENDNYQVKNGYMGLAMFYEGKSEGIPVINNKELGSLEYDLTSRIIKLTQSRTQVVGFLSGHGEHGIGSAAFGSGDDDYTGVAQVIRENYDVKTIDFAKQQTLEGVDLLIVAGPKRDLTDRAVFEIDQFLLAGGKAIFLIDGVNQLEGLNIEVLDTNARTLFETAGVVVEQNILLDTLSELTNFNSGDGQFFILQYPPFIRLDAQNFTSNPIVAKLKSFVMRFVSSISVEEKVDTLEYDRFANTSPGSWSQDFPFQLNPQTLTNQGAEDVGSKPVAVSMTGLFPRLTDAQSVPPLQEWVESEGDNDYELRPVSQDDNRSGREVLTEAQSPAKVVVFADSDFVADDVIRNDQSSLVVLLNAVDYLTIGEELVNIRSKSISTNPLGEFSNSEKTIIKFAGILLVPVLLAVFGFIRLWLRRKEEKMIRV